MPVQSEYPSEWVCEGEHKGVEVELRVPRTPIEEQRPRDGGEATTAGFEWIEIPTSEVELWVEKGEAADIQRTAKVRYPTEWGEDTSDVRHNSPRRLVNQYSSTDTQPFMFARIRFQREDGEWVYTHFGWVGGVGGTDSSEAGATSKLWVYDVSELLTGVPISVTFNDPSLVQTAEKTARLTNDNTPIPLSGVTLIGPGVEEAAKATADADDREDGEWTTRADAKGNTAYSDAGSSDDEDDSLPEPAGERYEAKKLTSEEDPLISMGSKTFVSNHDTLLDVYEWMEKRSESTMYFEPTEDGRSLELVVDVEPSRRTFTQDAVISNEFTAPQGRFDSDATEFHEPVKVLKNNTLYEMKPKNTVHLNGRTGRSSLDKLALDVSEDVLETSFGLDLESPSEKYPHVKVQVPSLVEAANGVEMAPELVESDAETLDQAERDARQRLRKLLEEPSEGEIILRGVPTVRPYDTVRAYEVCNSQVVFEADPVQYEVESVKHEKSATSFYTVRIRVSIWANETHIETVEKEMVSV